MLKKSALNGMLYKASDCYVDFSALYLSKMKLAVLRLTTHRRRRLIWVIGASLLVIKISITILSPSNNEMFLGKYIELFICILTLYPTTSCRVWWSPI